MFVKICFTTDGLLHKVLSIKSGEKDRQTDSHIVRVYITYVEMYTDVFLLPLLPHFVSVSLDDDADDGYGWATSRTTSPTHEYINRSIIFSQSPIPALTRSPAFSISFSFFGQLRQSKKILWAD